MEHLDLIITNGKVVLPTGVEEKDIGIKDGLIVQIKKGITNTADRRLDAEDQFVFPGVIDVHVHFSEPGREHWEGFRTGSMMMAAGGCTTYFDMPLNGIPSTVTQEALYDKARLGNEKSFVDFGLWGGLVPGNEKDLVPLAESGVIGFKAFLSTTGNKEFEAVDDITLLNGMKTIAKLNKVLALHSESAAITNWLKAEKEKEGKCSANDYLETRPILAEVEAVERAIYYAEITGCPLHFVHISSAKAVEKIEQAKQRGMDISVETCPHYLLFNHEHLRERGTVAKCAPPLREQEEQKKLISLFIEDKFDMISSDHSPCPYELKDPHIYNLFQAWGGISGGQFTLLSLIQLALKHNIPLEKVAHWTAIRPAERFGLSNRKGKIIEGADADLAIVTLNESYVVTEDNFYAKHKQSLYVGHTFPCRIVGTILRGKVVFNNGEITNDPAGGCWQKPMGYYN
ncbi:allantoinase [Paenibacillus jamilae]|uniref:Allantoinase n=1 Tax=Paenibacillus jamilae TaxID=114136 RepID=A0ACC4ZP74_9BACL|nr:MULTISPECIES: allantoinase [Paenibacillus]AUO09012.1 allantoinase [Paenibacillus sp. lzh-N1]KTS77464.1 allantoinase [Paenibacillus jamilae]